MSTSVATSQCVSCGEPIFATRFCEGCGTKVEVESGAMIVPPAPAADAEPNASNPAAATTVTAVRSVAAKADQHDAEEPGASRVTFGLLLAFNAIIWTPIVPLATALGIGLIGQWIGSWSLNSQVWPIVAIAALIAPVLMTLGFVLAAKSAPISARARRWAVVLAVVASLFNAIGAVFTGYSSGVLALSVPTLGALASIGCWGIIARFRGPGYWALLYACVAGILLGGVSFFTWVTILLVPAVALWALAVFGVVKLALAHERRAAAQPAPTFTPRPEASYAAGRTNGFAVTSLILSLVGGGVLAIIFGHVAHSQIRQSGESGSGMATAGLVIGYVSIVVSVIATIVVGVSIGTGVWR